jgi:hypothetical protein
MPWLYAVISRYQGNEVRTERHWYNFAAGKAYAMMEDGTVLGWDYTGAPKKLLYHPRLKALVIAELSGSGLGANATDNLISVFSVFAARDDVSKSTTQYDGRTVRAFGMEKAQSGVRSAASRQPAQDDALGRDDGPSSRPTPSIRRRQARGSRGMGHELSDSGPASVRSGVPASAVIDGTRRHIGTHHNEPTPVPTPASKAASGWCRWKLLRGHVHRHAAGRPGAEPGEARRVRGRRSGAPGHHERCLGKPVTSSDPEPVIGSLDQITDGDRETAEGSFVELGPAPQHVTIDLQERYEIYGVLLWHHHRWPRVYFDVIVQVSDDPGFRTGVQTIFNNDTDNTVGLGAGPDMNYTETNEGNFSTAKACGLATSASTTTATAATSESLSRSPSGQPVSSPQAMINHSVTISFCTGSQPGQTVHRRASVIRRSEAESKSGPACTSCMCRSLSRNG